MRVTVGTQLHASLELGAGNLVKLVVDPDNARDTDFFNTLFIDPENGTPPHTVAIGDPDGWAAFTDSAELEHVRDDLFEIVRRLNDGAPLELTVIIAP